MCRSLPAGCQAAARTPAHTAGVPKLPPGIGPGGQQPGGEALQHLAERLPVLRSKQLGRRGTTNRAAHPARQQHELLPAVGLNRQPASDALPFLHREPAKPLSRPLEPDSVPGQVGTSELLHPGGLLGRNHQDTPAIASPSPRTRNRHVAEPRTRNHVLLPTH